MSGNTYGTLFKVTTFGESHGAALGAVVDGCPAGLEISVERIQQELNRRRPGASADGKLNASVTARKEADEVEVLSGIFEGKSEGTPIAMVIRNTSQKSKDYSNIKDTFRPGHADFTYDAKYGFRDYRGGGRSSGRETASRVAAGAIARILLEKAGIKVTAYTIRAAGIQCKTKDLSQIEKNSLRACDSEAALLMEEKIAEFRKAGDSAGGIVECIVQGVPGGLGDPVFDKLDAELAKAMLSIGAVKGIEFGSGFAAADSTGSKNNDAMRVEKDAGQNSGNSIQFETNNSGGILGGISNGNTIIFRIAVKPVPSIFKKQETVSKLSSEAGDAGSGFENSDLLIEGRHDICLCPRIVPVVEAMTCIVLADFYLRNKSSRV